MYRVARNGDDLATHRKGMINRRSRTAPIRSLDDDDDPRKGGDDPVPPRKVQRTWINSERELADKGACSGDSFTQLDMARRMGSIDPAPQDRDGMPVHIEGPSMCCSIDPKGHPANHGDTLHGKVPRDFPREYEPIGGRMSRSDDRDGAIVRQMKETSDIEGCRRIGHLLPEACEPSPIGRGLDRAAQGFRRPVRLGDRVPGWIRSSEQPQIAGAKL